MGEMLRGNTPDLEMSLKLRVYRIFSRKSKRVVDHLRPMTALDSLKIEEVAFSETNNSTQSTQLSLGCYCDVVKSHVGSFL
jgi:hypothetical protein